MVDNQYYPSRPQASPAVSGTLTLGILATGPAAVNQA